MPAPKRPARLRHIPVKLRVTVDPASWTEVYGTGMADLDDDVRNYVVTMVQQSPAAQEGAVVSARRDGA